MRHLWVVFLAGCYSTVPIRPDEVMKMNDMSVSYGQGATLSGSAGGVPMVSIGTVELGRSSVKFVEPDGSVETVPGYADLWVTTPTRSYRFKEIVKVEDEGDRFMIRSSSRTGEIAKSDIRSTELRQLDRVKTVVATSVAAVLLTAPLVLFIVTR